MTKYSDKFKDPRWQKKRLEVMDRDGWHCVNCHESEKPLNVHHIGYAEDFEPWEYGGHVYQTLCEKCHNDAHSVTLHLCINYIKAIQRGFLSPAKVRDILGLDENYGPLV